MNSAGVGFMSARLGAVVVSKKRVAGKGFNKAKTHPLLHNKYAYRSIHAECDAALKAAQGDTIVVVRVMKNGKLTCSRPCEKCMRFIKDYGIKKVYYSDWDGTMKELSI